MNIVTYTLTFETQSGTATLVNLPWQQPQYFLSQAPSFSGGEFTPLYQMSFMHQGDAVLDLSGKTLDIEAFLTAPPHPIERVSWDITDAFLQNPRGHLTFGAGNSIVDWYIQTHDNTGSGELDAHWSQPKAALDSALVNLDDSRIFEGRHIYGDAFSNGDDHVYYFNPGRWQVSVRRLASEPADEDSGDLVV